MATISPSTKKKLQEKKPKKREEGFESSHSNGIAYLHKMIYSANNRFFKLYERSRLLQHTDEPKSTNRKRSHLKESNDEATGKLQTLSRLVSAYNVLLDNQPKPNIFMWKKGYAKEYSKMKPKTKIVMNLKEDEKKRRKEFLDEFKNDMRRVLRALYLQVRIKKSLKSLRADVASRKALDSGPVVFGLSDVWSPLSHRVVLTEKLADDSLKNWDVLGWKAAKGPGSLNEMYEHWLVKPDRPKVRKSSRRKKSHYLSRCRVRRSRGCYSCILKDLLHLFGGRQRKTHHHNAEQDRKPERRRLSTGKTKNRSGTDSMDQKEWISEKLNNFKVRDIFYKSSDLRLAFKGEVLLDRRGRGVFAETALGDKSCLVIVFAKLSHAYTEHLWALDRWFAKHEAMRERVGYVTVCTDSDTLELGLIMSYRSSTSLYTSPKGTLGMLFLMACRPVAMPCSFALDQILRVTSENTLDDLTSLGPRLAPLKWAGATTHLSAPEQLGFDGLTIDELKQHHVSGTPAMNQPSQWEYIFDQHTHFQPKKVAK